MLSSNSHVVPRVEVCPRTVAPVAQEEECPQVVQQGQCPLGAWLEECWGRGILCPREGPVGMGSGGSVPGGKWWAVGERPVGGAVGKKMANYWD